MKISEREFRFIEASQFSLSLSDIANETNLPYSTIHRTYLQLKKRASFSFIPDYKKMNLVNMTLIFDGNINLKYLHRYTISIRRLYGPRQYLMINALVLYPHIDKYLDTFNYEPIVKVIGKEFMSWRYDRRYSYYSKVNEAIMPKFDFLKDYDNNFFKPVSSTMYSDKAPDPIDLFIIMRKRNHPFEPILRGLR